MSSSIFDFAAAFLRVVSTSVSEKTKATRMTLANGAEQFDGVVAYGSLGLLGRPRAEANGEHADVVVLRYGDQAVPVGLRDARIDRAFPNGIAEGTIALAGYGGGSYSLLDTSGMSGDQKATVHVIYAPYEFSNGVPSKAHAIVLDTTPGSEGVQMVHGDGYFLQMQAGKGIRGAVDGSSFFHLGPGTFSVQATNIALNGNVVLGGTAGVPLLGGPASPPSTRVFIAP